MSMAELRRARDDNSLLGRWADPAEIAWPILWLACRFAYASERPWKNLQRELGQLALLLLLGLYVLNLGYGFEGSFERLNNCRSISARSADRPIPRRTSKSPAIVLSERGSVGLIPGWWLSPCNAAEKNYLRHLRPGVSQSLRQAAAPGRVHPCTRSMSWIT